jgi:hypothetical protein
MVRCNEMRFQATAAIHGRFTRFARDATRGAYSQTRRAEIQALHTRGSMRTLAVRCNTQHDFLFPVCGLRGGANSFSVTWDPRLALLCACSQIGRFKPRKSCRSQRSGQKPRAHCSHQDTVGTQQTHGEGSTKDA